MNAKNYNTFHDDDKNALYGNQLVTKQDLQVFKYQLLDALKDLLQLKPKEQKQWLKSYEVRKMLNVSAGTLQNLRVNGTLNYTKIGGLIYYSYRDIEKLLENNKVEHPQQKTKHKEGTR